MRSKQNALKIWHHLTPLFYKIRRLFLRPSCWNFIALFFICFVPFALANAVKFPTRMNTFLDILPVLHFTSISYWFSRSRYNQGSILHTLLRPQISQNFMKLNEMECQTNFSLAQDPDVCASWDQHTS